MRQIRRVGPSNDRVTHGAVYTVFQKDGRDIIEGDGGGELHPSRTGPLPPNGKVYWEEVNLTKEEPTMTNPTPIDRADVTITPTIMINNACQSCYSLDQLIGMMREEEQRIATLKEINTTSSAITKKIKQHEENLKQLAKIADARDE